VRTLSWPKPRMLRWPLTPLVSFLCRGNRLRTIGFAGAEFKNWSGARDLDAGPHGPNRVGAVCFRCPTESPVVLANTKSTSLVSFGDPLEPSGAGNA
jgi:hypothetical protein